MELPYKPYELPDDVLNIIKEYAMPVTRPDWRTLHRMTYEAFIVDFYYEVIKRTRYLNTHPTRDTLAHIIYVCTYKSMFTEYHYIDVFSKN